LQRKGFHTTGQVNDETQKMSRTKYILAALLALAALPHQAASAQQYPTKPIKMLIPVPPGAGVDIIVRKAGDALQPRLGQPFVVDNRASANMVTGADACAKGAPDGYTLCALSSLSMSYNPHTISSLPYNANRDFKPVVNMFFLLEGLLAKGSLPINSVKELQALAVAQPGKLNFGTLGPGSTTDISRQWIEERWNTTLTGIPYKGGPAVVQALAAGEIDFSRIGAYNALSLIKSGKLKLLALGGSKRSHLFPNVPTMDEAGLGSIVPARPWWGILAPAGTPDAIVKRINSEFVRLFRERSFEEFLDTQVVEIDAGTPEEFAALIKREYEYAGQIVRKYNVPMQ
jgi:tripartite-type tricarboxylate transporter receptor subunit TctC